jgi:hypothetical protein
MRTPDPKDPPGFIAKVAIENIRMQKIPAFGQGPSMSIEFPGTLHCEVCLASHMCNPTLPKNICEEFEVCTAYHQTILC